MEHSSVVVTISDPPCLDPVDGLATQHFKTQVDGFDARMECPLKLAQANVLSLETDREMTNQRGLLLVARSCTYQGSGVIMQFRLRSCTKRARKGPR